MEIYISKYLSQEITPLLSDTLALVYESFKTRQDKPPESVLSKMRIELQLIRRTDKTVFLLSQCLQKKVLYYSFFNWHGAWDSNSKKSFIEILSY